MAMNLTPSAHMATITKDTPPFYTATEQDRKRSGQHTQLVSKIGSAHVLLSGCQQSSNTVQVMTADVHLVCR